MTGANAYQFEVQGQAETIDAVAANDKDFSAGGQATYYFKNVDASKGPLAEAAFINQASNVAVAYNYGQFDEVESQNYGIKGEAYFPTSIVPAAYASLSYNAAFNDGKYGETDDHGDRWALEVGSVVAPNFLVTVGYTNVASQDVLDTFKIINKGIFQANIELIPLMKIKMRSLRVLNTWVQLTVHQCQLVSKRVSFMAMQLLLNLKLIYI